MIKNKQFEEWYLKLLNIHKAPIDIKTAEIDRFKENMFCEQWGVYLEFFDSVGVHLDAFIGKSREKYHYEIFGDGIYKCKKTFNTRQEAQQEAIKKAFEILEND